MVTSTSSARWPWRADHLSLLTEQSDGDALSRDRVTALVENTRGVVIIDEAYAEFTGATLTDLARAYHNVFVTRTFSKAFGLAGLRVGYGLGAAGLVAAVEKARGPYKVSVTAEHVAVAVLRDDLEWVRASGNSRSNACSHSAASSWSAGGLRQQQEVAPPERRVVGRADHEVGAAVGRPGCRTARASRGRCGWRARRSPWRHRTEAVAAWRA